MSNPAFIVDGHTEQKFLGCICPGQPIRRTNLNGKSVTISAIANKIASLIRLLGNRHYPIIIIIDRESRIETAEELSSELHNQLIQLGLGNHDLRVGFADRMIENWIIADFEKIGKIAKKPIETDGLRGSSVIKKHKGSYNKVIDGVNLLLSVDKKVVYNSSPSYRRFIDLLDGIECGYLNFEK